jgi:hypothetical protein
VRDLSALKKQQNAGDLRRRVGLEVRGVTRILKRC